MPLDGNPLGWVSQVAPVPRTDAVGLDLAPPRLSRWGEPYLASIVPTKHLLADEGGYYFFSSPTIGTTIALGGVQAAFSDTAPAFYFENRHPTKNLFIDSVTASYFGGAITTTVNNDWHWAAVADTRRRFTTDNTVLLTPQPTHSAGGTPLVMVKAQNSATASVISASSSRKKVVGLASFSWGSNGEDQTLLFGAARSAAKAGATAWNTGSPGRYVSVLPPHAIAPGHSLTLHLWLPTMTGGSFACEVWGGFYLR